MPTLQAVAVSVSDYSPLNANLRRGVRRFIRAMRRVLLPGVSPNQMQSVQTAARAAMARAYQRGQAERQAPGEPAPETPGSGIARPPGPQILYSPEQQRRLNARSARHERFTARAGYGPVGWSTHQELDLPRITRLHREVDTQGVLLEKDDTDRKILRTDPHLMGVDRARRSKVFKAPLLFKPANKSAPARIVCNFIRQVFDDFDGLPESVGEMLFANAGGVQAQEVIWRPPREVPVVLDRDNLAVITAETIEGLEPVFNRYLRYDVVTDRPWIDMGGQTVDPYRDPESGEPLYKFLFHKTFGDGHARQRGYMFAVHYYHYFKTVSIEKWISILETYGVPTPYLLMRGAGFTSDEDRDDAFAALAENGTGKPAVIHERWGDLKHNPIPTGVDARGMHAAIIGMINEEESKAVQGETLTAEIGDVGSYKASDTHADQQESVQWIDARMSATTLRRLARFLVEVNDAELARIAGVSPEAVRALVPRVAWFLDRKVDPVARLGMFKTAMVDMHIPVDPDQIYDEFHMLPPQEGAPPPPMLAPPATTIEGEAPEQGAEGR